MSVAVRAKARTWMASRATFQKDLESPAVREPMVGLMS
jgi:hypothetical protein